MQVKVLKSLSRDDVLWRYMTLDKFVDLISSQSLFFTPLSFYASTDPFEGYPPAVALEAMYRISDQSYATMESLLDKLACDPVNAHLLNAEPAMKMRLAIEKRPENFKKHIDAVFKGTLVSCWYKSMYQSEAMWNLYSDQHKGVALRTTVGRLQDSLAVDDCAGRTVFIGSVKYIDYNDSDLTPPDCVTDGMTIPLLKRVSFSHENEVRAFFVSDVSSENVERFEPSAKSLSIDVQGLIGEVYISPYAKPPFPTSVRAICKAFELNCPVIDSDLLSGADKLFDFSY